MSTGETVLVLPGSTSIITLIDCLAINQPYRVLESTNVVGYNFYINSLIATCYIASLDRAPIPNIFPEDSLSEKEKKIREIQFNYPHLDLCFYVRESDNDAWVRRCRIPVQNRGAEYYLPCLYPYLTTEQVKVLGRTSKLGVAIEGGQLVGSDSIVLQADWEHEVDLKPKPIEELQNTRGIGFDIGIDPVLICPARPTRGLVWLQNSGTERIFLFCP